AAAAGIFAGCCRLMGALLRLYPHRMTACIAPFSALLQSLLRTAFHMAAAVAAEDAATATTAETAAGQKQEHGGIIVTFFAAAATAAGAAAVGSTGRAAAPWLAALGEAAGWTAALARPLSRLLEVTAAVAKEHAAFRRLLPYLLASFVQLSLQLGRGGGVPLPAAGRRALLAGMHPLLDTCSGYEVQQAACLLDTAGAALLQQMHANHYRMHRYTGRM
ncbi:unnamed protein product, partial [Phaeothamnion confervicola]